MLKQLKFAVINPNLAPGIVFERIFNNNTSSLNII